MTLKMKEWIAKVTRRLAYADFWGAVSGSSAIANKSLASGTSWVNLGSFKPPQGLWHILVDVSFPANATGRRGATVATASASAGAGLATASAQAVNGYVTHLHLDLYQYVDGNTTLYVNAFQNSGSALTVTTRYTACRMARYPNVLGG